MIHVHSSVISATQPLESVYMAVRHSGGVICVLCLVQPAVWECVTE